METAPFRQLTGVGNTKEQERRLPQASRLTLPLKEGQDVALSNRALDISHDVARRVVEELDTDLRHVSSLARAAKDPAEK